MIISRPTTLAVAILAIASVAAPRAVGQTTAADKLKAMGGDLDALDGKRKKDKDRPPFEFYRSQVTPFDVLPYVKRSHWSTLNMEMQANAADYDGFLQTSSEFGGQAQIKLLGMPHAMVFRREARMTKEQRTRLGLQVFLPQFLKELSLELGHPDSIRPEGLWSAPIMRLETHQMVIPILSPDPSPFESWKRMQATIPTSGDRESGSSEIERQRYYRMASRSDPTQKVPLSPQPLTWTSISHLVWDAFSPEELTSGQQEAMIDWLYFGGQLIVPSAGPASLAPLQDSFLSPYLPATASGENARLSQADFEDLSGRYPPPLWPNEFDTLVDTPGIRRSPDAIPARYKAPEPIRPPAEKPVFLSGLLPKPGAAVIPLGDPGKHPLAVEWRVGRGRVIMLAINPNDPAFAAWPGMDSLVRRVILRRVEEGQNTSDFNKRLYKFLGAPQLTWLRLMGRDIGLQAAPEDTDATDPNDPNEKQPVAAWLDRKSELPVMSCDALERASGITIPGSNFVLKVIVGYIAVLVPLNWLICRFVFRRREWAWVAVPVLSLGFAVAVERAAAYDMGFDSDCTEIDVLEFQGNHPRAHLSRFAAIYSTGRDKYAVSYPNDPSALILPLNTERALRGEENALSVFESFPVPALKGFQVQPRSLAMFRAEAIVNLPGAIALSPDGTKVQNGTNLDLQDAVLIDVDSGEKTQVGTIGAGETILVGGPSSGTKAKPAVVDWTDKQPFVAKLEEYRSNTPEERGELRLVAWAPDPHPGQVTTPKVDRHRGFRLVVAHLKYGLPDPAGPDYYSNPAAKTR